MQGAGAGAKSPFLPQVGAGAGMTPSKNYFMCSYQNCTNT